MKKFYFLFVVLFAFLGLNAQGVDIINPPSLTVSDCSFPTPYFALDNIVISETQPGDISDVNGGGDFVLTAPSGFEFQSNTGTVSITAGADLSINNISITTTTISFSIIASSTGSLDEITISGINVRGINSASGPSDILRTTSGGTDAAILGDDVADAVSHGSLTSVLNASLPVSVSIAASSTTICTGTLVTFTATPTNEGTNPSYQWKLNGSNVGTNSPTYTTNALTDNDKITVVLTSDESCATGNPATSNQITMTVNSSLPVSVSIAASSTTICTGTSVTFTATPTNEGTNPSYQWKLNASNVHDNLPIYTTNTLTDNDKITVVLTSDESCATGNPATSNQITMTVNSSLPVSVSIAASATTICT